MALPGVIGALGLGGTTPADPYSILGPLLFADYYAADRDDPSAVNPRITVATGVSSWPEEASRNTAVAQAVGGKQPALSATSFNGRPGVTFDGVDDFLKCTLSPTIAAGGRAYIFAAAQILTTTGTRRHLSLEHSTDASALLMQSTDATHLGYAWVGINGGADGTTYAGHPATVDTTARLYEYGNRSVTADQFVKSATGYAGTLTGTLANAVSVLQLATVNPTTPLQWSNICFHRIIIAHNTSSITAEPSAAQIAAMRTLLGVEL
jgi:hypothetical protein